MLQRVQISKESAEGQRANPFGKGKGMTAGVDDIQSVQPEIGKGGMHGAGGPGFGSVLELKAQPLAVVHDQKVKLCPAVGTPEKALLPPGAKTGDPQYPAAICLQGL